MANQAAVTAPRRERMVRIDGGTFQMGSGRFYPDERPVHAVTVDGFWIDAYAVTNAEFSRFVEATAYVTLAERPLDPHDYPGAIPEMLVPGSLVFCQPSRRVGLDDWSLWWAYIPGADWRHPEGPESSIDGKSDVPVVHVAHEDALAYAAWIGKALPTEAEWEYAARGGLEGATFCWGDEALPDGRRMANTWMGEFPWQNLRDDGKLGPTPVGSFPPNGYGLYDMAGNVWEWTSDWYRPVHGAGHACCGSVTNPRGGRPEESFDPLQPNIRIPRKVLKGGSYLCAPNYCFRFRPAARSPQMLDSSTCHLGFRCVSRDDKR